MRKVLIPTDFSDNAMNAIKYAMEIFKYEQSELVIMHVYADEVYDRSLELSRVKFEKFREKVRENSDIQLQKVVKEMNIISPNPKHKYSYLSAFGGLVEEVNDWVDRENMDLVVMGTKGKTNDKDITFGSNTLQVVKYVKCPVLAIPSMYKGVCPTNILFPTDYQLPFQKRELKLISTLAKRFVATINFLYASQFKDLSYRQQDNKSIIESSVCDNETSFHIVGSGNLTTLINDFIKENDINMLVMVNTRHTYFENILHTTTIEKIGLNIQIPFLVLQNLPRY